MTTTIDLPDKKITFPFNYVCSCCDKEHTAIQFSQDLIEYLDYLFSYTKDFLENTINDNEQEETDEEEYKEDCYHLNSKINGHYLKNKHDKIDN